VPRPLFLPRSSGHEQLLRDALLEAIVPKGPQSGSREFFRTVGGNLLVLEALVLGRFASWGETSEIAALVSAMTCNWFFAPAVLAEALVLMYEPILGDDFLVFGKAPSAPVPR